MNDQDDLGGRIARLLDEGAHSVSAAERARLIEARRLALARHRARTAPEWVPAWAEGFSDFTQQSVFGVRYLVPVAALVLGLLGVVYMNSGSVSDEVAEIDAALLADELPISAYLDQGFDAWLKRSSH